MNLNMHLRGVDAILMSNLKKKAHDENISLNSLVLLLLRRSLGLSGQRNLAIYHDLDSLAGTWTKQQAKAFTKQISDFEQIDKEIWK